VSGGLGGFGSVVGANGGAGVVFAASGAKLVNSFQIFGGDGGNGGTGGNGGIGVVFLGANNTIINSGQIQGGFGRLPNGGGPGGFGSVGISGAGLTIDNSGTINGGLNTNSVRLPAIDFTGGTNFLGGSGTINGGIRLDAGSLMPALPGSAVGLTLNVNGPVLFASGSTYVVRVNGAANDSVTSIANGSPSSASVSGANVVASVTGAPGSALGQHTIITANSIFGTFASVSINSAFLTAALSHDATHVLLTLTGNGPNGGIDFTPVAQNPNQAAVAGALNAAGNANGFSGSLINTIAGFSAAQASSAFAALDGEAATGAQRASFRFMDEFLNLMLDPFVEGHFGNPAGGGATGFAAEQQAELPPEVASAYASAFKAAPPANFDQRWSVWNAAFGGSGKTSGDPVVGSSDTRFSTFGFAAGVDYRFSPYTTIGLAAAGGGTNWGLANGLGGGRSDSAQIGVYAKTRIGPAYLAESVAFANHWFSTDRTALGDNLHAVFTGQSFGGRIEGGYRFAVMPTLGITPYAAAQAQAFRSGAYSETDVNNAGFGLSYAAKEATDVRTELGARLDSPTLLNGTPLVIRARLAWAHDFVDTPSLVAAFQTLPLSNFTVFGAPIPRDSALASLGADWYLNRDWKLTAKFDGEFASRSDIYAGTVALRYVW